MSFQINAPQYMEYLATVAQKIESCQEYISALDAATGDGDHWANLNMGFQKLMENKDALSQLTISDCFKKIGLLMMSNVGGSSGVLYGGAYIAAAKTIHSPELDANGLGAALSAMVNDMMQRGNTKPGYKTMIDSLYPAVNAYQSALAQGKPEREALEDLKAAAIAGAEQTKDMEAIRGRASYQLNKGVGHLDPGAVTMSYQLECLSDYIIKNILQL